MLADEVHPRDAPLDPGSDFTRKVDLQPHFTTLADFISRSPDGTETPVAFVLQAGEVRTLWAPTGKARIENNNLTGNTTAGIRASNGAIVDAGDCTGDNITGCESYFGIGLLRSTDGGESWAAELRLTYRRAGAGE